MKVKQLKLEGFRGFEQLTLTFNPDAPTVIIGENGVGKSSILDALAILLSWFMKEVKYEMIARHNHPEDYQDTLKITGTTKSDLDQNTTFKNNLDVNNQSIEFQRAITVNYDQEDFKWRLFKNRDDQELTQNGDTIENLAKLCRTQLRNQKKIPIVIHYGINRYIDNILLEIQDNYSFKPIDAYENALGENKVNFTSFFQWFRAREDLENEKRTDDFNYRDKQLEAVRKAITSLIPEFKNLRVRRSPLRMTVNKNGQELIIDQLSDGEKGLLAMVGDIARRLAIANPSLDNPLEGEGIVLIDEIELHLHPKWQQNIIPQLTKTFPNLQFIVTTHSPIVLSYVQPENIYLLKHSENGIIATHPQTSYGRDIVEIVEDIMGISSRPSFIKQQIDQLFKLIAMGDLEEAKKLREKIGQQIHGVDDGDLVRANASIRRKEILNR